MALYLDLAVGTHPAGAETWADPDSFARGVSLGAPPDALGPEGQVWTLAPLDPHRARPWPFPHARRDPCAASSAYAKLLRIGPYPRVRARLLGRAPALPRRLCPDAARGHCFAVVRNRGRPRGRHRDRRRPRQYPRRVLQDALAASGILGCRLPLCKIHAGPHTTAGSRRSRPEPLIRP